MSLNASGISPQLLEEIERVLNPFDLRCLFPKLESLRMAAPDDEEEDPDEDEIDEEEEEEGSGSGGTGSGQEAKKKADDPEKKRLSDEAAKYRRLRREERQRAEKLEAQLREIADKDKSDSEKLQSELQAVTAERDDLKERTTSLAREVAIARATRGKGITDFDLLDFLLTKEKVEYLDEDGEIADIGETVETLIKRRPSLVATGGGKDDDEDDGSAIDSGKPNGKKKKGTGTDFETLASKFPALRR